MGKRGIFSPDAPSIAMIVPADCVGFVPLDSVALPGEDVKVIASGLHIPSLQLVPIHAVLERTVAYEAVGENGSERRLCRRSQIAVRPEDVVHGQQANPEKPWKEWRRYGKLALKSE